MALTANLNLTGRAALAPGEYTIEDDLVLYSCKRCGGVDVLNSYDISPDGKVTPPWACPTATCPAAAYLELGEWRT